VAQYRWWYDAEQFPETDEEWETLEELVREYTVEFAKWHLEENPEADPDELTPAFLIAWLREEATTFSEAPDRDLSSLVRLPPEEWTDAEVAAYPNDYHDLVIVQGLEKGLRKKE
jgi:hypothetical protein